MSRHRFIVDITAGSKEPETGELLELTDVNQIHQMRKVLRLTRDSEVDLLDGLGNLYSCRIEELDRERVRARIIEMESEPQSNSPSVAIALAVIKNDRFDLAIQKLTELGVERITPVYCQRSVVKKKDSSPEKKKEARWMSIAKEACEQSERFRLPIIDSPIQLEEYLTSFVEPGDGSASFICAARNDAPPLVQQLLRLSSTNASQTVPLSHIRIVIGPEGGFTRSEIDKAIQCGFHPCNLTKTILRSETAAIASATMAISVGDFL